MADQDEVYNALEKLSLDDAKEVIKKYYKNNIVPKIFDCIVDHDYYIREKSKCWSELYDTLKISGWSINYNVAPEYPYSDILYITFINN